MTETRISKEFVHEIINELHGVHVKLEGEFFQSERCETYLRVLTNLDIALANLRKLKAKMEDGSDG